MNGLINLGDMPFREPRKARKSLRGFGIEASWRELVTAEPRLQELMDEVRQTRGIDYTSCPLTVWYGYQDVERGLKKRLQRFMLDGDGPPFYAVYEALFNSFRPCRHCMDRDLVESDIEADVASYLGVLGVPCRRQVRTTAGVIDILTDTSVIELKLWLTRSEIFRAVGQVVLYSASVGGDRQKIIIGQETTETLSMTSLVEAADIVLKTW